MLRKETNRIIFHHSLSDEVSLEDITRWHKERGFSTIGYHYIVHQNGKVEQGRDLAHVGAHCKGRNGDSIGVCLIGDFRRYEPTAEQIQACYDLYSNLHNIYRKKLRIEFHREKDNPCPGPKLDRGDFREILNRIKTYTP